jgi:hypothetical protein
MRGELLRLDNFFAQWSFLIQKYLDDNIEKGNE